MTAASHHPHVSAASSASSRPRLLLLTHRLPYPPDRGDRIRSYHLLRHLSQHFQVDLACVSDEPVWLQHHQLLSTMARRVLLQPISTKWSALRAAAALLSGQAITPAWHYRVGLAQEILQWHQQKPFDLVLTFCTGMIRYARLLCPPPSPQNQPPSRSAASHPPARRVRHILDLVDVDSLKWDSYADRSWPPLSWIYRTEARRLRRIEAGHFDQLDAITVISDAEARAYRQHVGDHPLLTVVPNGVDLDYFSPLPDTDAHTLVFTGVLNYRPNTEAVIWFARQVMPLLRQQVPDARFLIVGRHPTPAVEELAQIPGVQVIGSVPDVRVYLEQASIAVAPLLLARGTQNKVLEAMAARRAVVCSPAAAAGIDAQPGQHLIIAESPEDWVRQILQLWSNPAHRNTLAAAARQWVQQHRSWDQAVQPMIQLIHRLLASSAEDSSSRPDTPALASSRAASS